MRKIEISKGKIFLIICILLFGLFIGNKIYTNKVINNMEKQVRSVIEPVIERIKLTSIEEMKNGEKISQRYTIKFKSLELSSYIQENIKNMLRGKAYVQYAVCDEEDNEWDLGAFTIPVIRGDKKEKFEIEWSMITSIGIHDFFILDILDDFEYQQYDNYEETMKNIILFNPEDEEKFSECSSSGRDNREEIKFDEKGNLLEVKKLETSRVWTGAVASMSFNCEYNLKEFTGEETGDGIIINIRKTCDFNPFWYINIDDIEKINFWTDKENGDGQELIKVSDKDKIQNVMKVLKRDKYEYLLNEKYYELNDGIKEYINISFEFKKGPYMHVVINKNGVFVSDQQAIVSSEKSREILDSLMEIIQE